MTWNFVHCGIYVNIFGTHIFTICGLNILPIWLSLGFSLTLSPWPVIVFKLCAVNACLWWQKVEPTSSITFKSVIIEGIAWLYRGILLLNIPGLISFKIIFCTCIQSALLNNLIAEDCPSWFLSPSKQGALFQTWVSQLDVGWSNIKNIVVSI